MTKETKRGLCAGCNEVHDNPLTPEEAKIRKDNIRAVLGGADRVFSGKLDDVLDQVFTKLFGGTGREEPAAEKHPAGSIARIIRVPVIPGAPVGLEWLGDFKPDTMVGQYVYPGAPTVASSDQANAAVQAMQNLGYQWQTAMHRWITGAVRPDSGENAQARDQAAASIAAAAQAMSPSLEPVPVPVPPHIVSELAAAWKSDDGWFRAATAIGLTPADSSPEATMAYRLYLTITRAES